MLAYPDINPVLAQIGSMQIRWYGLLYVISFLIGYFFLRYNLRMKKIEISGEDYDSFIFYMMLGVIIGGRLGYVLFYDLLEYMRHPLHIFAVWEGGMSFHGGAVGVIIAGVLFCRSQKISFYRLADPTMPLVAIGLGLGRIGNFINGELYGRITTVPWGMVFPGTDGTPRHPSQLYEAFLEGFIMALVLQFILKKTRKEGLVFWGFILLYGCIRFMLEFVREPDALPIYDHGMLFGFMSIGQILSSIMIICSIIGIGFLYRTKKEKNEE